MTVPPMETLRMTQTQHGFGLVKKMMFIVAILGIWTGTRPLTAADQTQQYDVVIYGGTSAGIAAAVQVRRMGRSVVVIEPSGRIGGLTTGGLGQTDIGNKAAIGGVVREYYDDPTH